jgi:rieske iron-sulfur protein
VAHGPARKRLPVLPLSKDDKGTIIVAAGFIGKPGPQAT